MPTCNDCAAFRGDRCTHPDGRTAAAFYHEACGLFVAPLTPAEQAQLTAYEQRHPMALMDIKNYRRWQELRQRAGLE